MKPVVPIKNPKDSIISDQPRVVVVTVCRNALFDLKVTVESVQEQNYSSVIHIVIDGNSSDGTPQFLNENSKLFNIAISEPDSGIYDAMNKAIDLCPKDSWVIFLNAGDRFVSKLTLSQIPALLQPGIDIIFGDVCIRNGAFSKYYPARRNSRYEMPGCHQSTLTRVDLLKRLKFDTGFKVGADFDFYLRATKLGCRVAFCNGIISQVAPEGYSARNEYILQSDYVRIISRHVGIFESKKWLLKRKIRITLKHHLAPLLHWIGR